ncbi:hypothetical protein [Rossellomorea sp. GCM10028870]|uniref:hypothetical protein n=1 Tax=Rossellomorea sp. GCM10028870 TaxID=3273426 RepID=UPI00262EF182|nr:hypothetical protein [uncultured Rossellomorea sp.]
MELTELKRQLRSFCRRNRTALRSTDVGEYTAEEITEIIIERIGAEEVKKILMDIEVINRRSGDTVKYFILILEGLKAA